VKKRAGVSSRGKGNWRGASKEKGGGRTRKKSLRGRVGKKRDRRPGERDVPGGQRS